MIFFFFIFHAKGMLQRCLSAGSIPAVAISYDGT